jgi:hypothetical protein
MSSEIRSSDHFPFCGITFCKEMGKYKEVRDIIQQQPKSQFPFCTKSIEKNEREKELISICVMVVEYNCFFPKKNHKERILQNTLVQ